MYKIKNSDIPFLTLSKENFFTICNSLEYDEIGIIFKAFMDYVYFGIEPTFEKKYMRGIFDGVLQTMERKAEGCFASRENGKKGGRPKKNNTDLQPNTDFDEKAEISPNEAIEDQNDIVIPQEGESVSEGLICGEFDNIVEQFEEDKEMGMLVGTLTNYREVATECRAEQTKFNIEGFVEWLKVNNNCLYTKMMRTPSSSLSIDANMKKLEESLDNQLQMYIQDKTKRQQLYIYLIENRE